MGGLIENGKDGYRRFLLCLSGQNVIWCLSASQAHLLLDQNSRKALSFLSYYLCFGLPWSPKLIKVTYSRLAKVIGREC